VTSLASNPYFSAGFGLFGVGSAAAVGRNAAKVASAAFKRHFVTTLEVPCNDKSFKWMLAWISREAGRGSQHLSVRTHWEEEDGGRVRATYTLEPRPGVHVLRWGGAWIRLDRVREQQQVDVIGGVPWETVTLTTLGRRRPLLLQMLDEARKDVLDETAGLTLMYGCTGRDWRELGPAQPSRSMETVILEGTIAEDLIKDTEAFLTSGAWYRQRGIPHRRGYLLHGPPGCGKTTFIASLAGHLNLAIAVVSLADPNMTDADLVARLADAPKNSIILVEDIDAAFISRSEGNATKTAHDGLSNVTLTGLLNALDGVVGADARITFLTTNYPERLDPALVRPGRVDVKQYIGWSNKKQLQKMFMKFYPSATPEEAEKFGEVGVRNGKVSAAQVQAHLLLHKEDPAMAVLTADIINRQDSWVGHGF